MKSAARLSIQENGEGLPLRAILEQLPGVSEDALRRQFLGLNVRINKSIRADQAFEVDLSSVRTTGVAGVIKLVRSLELEVVPKFLSKDDPEWREDFFTMAAATQYGRVLPRERLATGNAKDGILDIMGRALYASVEKELRKPIRQYRRHTWSGFNITGEVEPEDLLQFDEDGFKQSGLSFDRRNDFNRTIQGAMNTLGTQARDSDLRRLLTDRARRFGPQSARGKTPPVEKISSRNFGWREPYAISLLVQEGERLTLSSGSAHAASPGFVINTERAWEQFLFRAVRHGLPDAEISKKGFLLGSRKKIGIVPGGPIRTSSVDVTPDISVKFPTGYHAVLDAKYKGRVGEELAIQAADLYECLAFLKATGARRGLLLYPLARRLAGAKSGSARVFETVSVGDLEVSGLAVSVPGLAREGGLPSFAKTLVGSLGPLLKD